MKLYYGCFYSALSEKACRVYEMMMMMMVMVVMMMIFSFPTVFSLLKYIKTRKMPLSCRFYEQHFPEKEDVVMCNVRSIAEMGAYVDLLEYKDIEGMILLSELSRRRIRSINKLIRVGRSECVVVIRVDKDKGQSCYQ